MIRFLKEKEDREHIISGLKFFSTTLYELWIVHENPTTGCCSYKAW